MVRVNKTKHFTLLNMDKEVGAAAVSSSQTASRENIETDALDGIDLKPLLFAGFPPTRKSRISHFELCLLKKNSLCRDWSVLVKDTSTELVKQGGISVAVWVAGKAVARVYGSGEHNLVASLSQLAAAQTIGSSVLDAVNKLYSSLSSYKPTPKRSLMVLHGILKSTMEHDLDSAPSWMRLALENHDNLISAALEKDEVIEAEVMLRRRQSLLLPLNLHVVNISHQQKGGEINLRRCIDNNVEKLIGSYSDDMKETLSSLVGQIRANCFLKNPRRMQVYLQGSPGTGKTRFARRLADALQLPLVLINLKNSNMSDLSGEKSYPEMVRSATYSDEKTVGTIPFGMIKSNTSNPIILMDEAGDMMSDYHMTYDLKSLLDPERLSLDVPAFLNGSVDFSRATVILTGNANLGDSALLSRLKQINFTALPRSRKKMIISREIQGIFENHGELSIEVGKNIEVETLKHIDSLLDSDQHHGFHGVRVLLEVTKDLVSWVRVKILSLSKIEESSVKLFIEESFKERLLVLNLKSEPSYGHML